MHSSFKLIHQKTMNTNSIANDFLCFFDDDTCVFLLNGNARIKTGGVTVVNSSETENVLECEYKEHNCKPLDNVTESRKQVILAVMNLKNRGRKRITHTRHENTHSSDSCLTNIEACAAKKRIIGHERTNTVQEMIKFFSGCCLSSSAFFVFDMSMLYML